MSREPIRDTGLCIGGPLDGQRKAILHGARFAAPVLPSIRATLDVPTSPTAPRPVDAFYRRMTITTPEGVFGLWVAEPATDAEALNMLITGYRS